MFSIFLSPMSQISLVRKKHGEAVDWCHKLEETYERAHRLTDQLLVMVRRITLQQQLPGHKGRQQHQEETLQHQLGQDDTDTAEEEGVEKCCDLMHTIRQQQGRVTGGGLFLFVFKASSQC